MAVEMLVCAFCHQPVCPAQAGSWVRGKPTGGYRALLAHVTATHPEEYRRVTDAIEQDYGERHWVLSEEV